MSTITIKRAEQAVQENALHDAILATHPELAATLRVEASADEVLLTLPDDVDPVPIEAIVAAHDGAAAQVARAAAATERTAAETELRDQLQLALDRLAAIVNDPAATDTAAKVRTALLDVARIQRRILRYVATQAR